jgi:hypothetical protein
MSTLEHATERSSGAASTTPVATPERKRPASAEQASRQRAAGAAAKAAAQKTAGRNHDRAKDEAAATKAAIGRAVRDARLSIGTVVDIRLWTKKAPWIAIGAAAATGLVAAVCVRRTAAAAATTTTENGAPPRRPPEKSKAEQPAKAGWTASLANSLFELAKAAVETAIMTGIRETAARSFDDGQPSDEIVSHSK